MLRFKPASLRRLIVLWRNVAENSSCVIGSIWLPCRLRISGRGSNSAISAAGGVALCGHTSWHTSHPQIRPFSVVPSGSSSRSSTVRHERHRRASTPASERAAAGHALKQAPQLPQLKLQGASGSTSAVHRISHKNTLEPVPGTISCRFAPIKPTPASTAPWRSRTGAESTQILVAVPGIISSIV